MASATLPPTGLLRVVADGGALGTWSDADLLARFAATRCAPDDQAALAFEVLVRRHGALVRGVCRRILLDPGDADDAFQATFLVLVRRAGSICVGDSLAPWLFGVARRTALRARLDRDRRRRREGSGHLLSDRPAVEATDPRLAEVLAVLDAEVARLPEPFRSALVLCDLGGRTIEEAGRESGCPPGTIKSRLHRARDRLRTRLARRGYGGPSSPTLGGLGLLSPPPERLVASLVARCSEPTPLGPSRSLFSWFPFWQGVRRMTSLWVTRWAAGATLSAALGVLGTTFLAQTPNQIPGGQKINTPPGAGVPAEPPSRASTDRVPNEANKVALPDYVVEPPDILSIEALEALPGRPITGEHLVQPNGKISLGFYGDLYVAGLTTSEIKAKVVLHLRKFLTDEVLGLERLLPDGTTQAVAPAESNRVFVQIAAYNSKVYYVQGALVTPGRLPVTGNETVLDAINFAGGILFADSGQAEITVFRPALDAKRELQKLAVDLKAIQRGDTRTNYQMMPGDRLVVARNPPLTDEEWGNARLMQKVQDQGARLDALEKKLDRILEKLDAQSPAPAPPAGK